jgi:hypothetical protein
MTIFRTLAPTAIQTPPIEGELYALIKKEKLREKFATALETIKKTDNHLINSKRSFRPQEVTLKGVAFLAKQGSVQRLLREHGYSKEHIPQIMAKGNFLNASFSKPAEQLAKPDKQPEVKKLSSRSFQIEKNGALAFIWDKIKAFGEALFIGISIIPLIGDLLINYFANRKVERIKSDLPPEIAPAPIRLSAGFTEEEHPLYRPAPVSPQSSTENSSATSRCAASSLNSASSGDEQVSNSPLDLEVKKSFTPHAVSFSHLDKELRNKFNYYLKVCKKSTPPKEREAMNAYLNQQVSAILEDYGQSNPERGIAHPIFKKVMMDIMIERDNTIYQK